MLSGLTGVAVVFASTELPDIKDLAQASYICAADAQAGQCTPQVAMARLKDEYNRTNVPLAQVPEPVVNAVIAMEDRNFYEHDGVVPTAVFRALIQNVKGGGVSQGGSTITQQYVKNAFELSRERAIDRKIKEAVLSIKLEKQMSKDEILEGYLNTIYFGRGAYGVGAAAQAYFGKTVQELGPSEGALLAGLIRAPNLAEPTKYPDEATRRRHTALVAMKEEGYVTPDEFTMLDAATAADIGVVLPSSAKKVDTLRGAADPDYMGTDYISEYVKGELHNLDPEKFTDPVINGGGLRIYTSIDYDAQRAAWQAVTTTLDREDDPATPEWEGDPEASMVAVDDQGLVRAMVASRHRYAPEAGYFENYAVRGYGSNGRQPGSTFKPIVLAEAIREGYSLTSRFDAQGTMELPGWNGDTGEQATVSNYSESDAGTLDLVAATRESSNTAYAQLILALGTEPVDPDGNGKMVYEGTNNVAELATSMGIGGSGGIPEQSITPAMVLGTVNTSPLEMAGAYSTFANRGFFRQPDIITRVEQVDQDGNATVLYERQLEQTQVLSEGQADLVTYAMQAVLGTGGTGESANLGKPAAGKTGTSNQNRDSWFAGFVPKMTAVVWMGYPDADYPNPETGNMELWPMNNDGRPVHGKAATGGSFPAEIWKKFMQVATDGTEDPFVEPTKEQIKAGTVINKGSLLTPDEAATSTTERGGWPPDFSIPDFPGNGGGGGNNTTVPTTTSTRPGQGSTPTSSPITLLPPNPDG
ncbi:MAG TPA: transglycosylase domain-containing protein [Acidimicrobiales bacterium]|nr:transglycosylase domain-containing protein [Acidimicrobiales bacterium]